MDYSKLIQEAIDLHVHIGPEIIPRKYSLDTLCREEQGKIAGMGVKNHFFPTVAMRGLSENEQPLIIFSVTLNHYQGGFNPSIIYGSAELSELPIIVWFPTIHAANGLRQQTEEIPSEWIDPQKAHSRRVRKAREIEGLSVLTEEGKLRPEVVAVVQAIKETDAILATGHLSWQESEVLIRYAREVAGVRRIIVTHPIYPKIAMPLEVQKQLAAQGVVMEHCYSMYSIDGVAISEIAAQIREVGAEHCVLSSDVGQSYSASPSEALADFARLLAKEGITEKELRSMLVDNPRKLVE